MKQLETEISIDASAAAIWQQLMDFEQYPTWNPFITAIKGHAAVGEQLENTISLKEGKAQVFKPRILTLQPEEEFRWLGKLYISGLFDGEHYFKLIPINAQQTRLIHGEKFSGLLVPVLMPLIGEDTKKGFIRMNQALKTRVENSSL